MSNPLHKINVCNRSASLTFKTRQVEDISLQNMLKASLVLSTYVSNCHPHSTLSSCQPLIEGVKVTHMWKTARDGPLHLSNYSPANSPSLPSSLPAPSGVDLDYLPPNDLTRPQLWKKLSKILLKTLDCQLHGQLQCCYLNLKLILQPWPQIVQRISRASSKFLTIWTSGGMNNIWCMKTIFYVPAGCNLTLLKFMGAL